MFRANLVCTFTIKGVEKLGTVVGPIACGVFAGTGGAWLHDGSLAAHSLVKPRSPMFLALVASIWTLLCTNAEKFRWPLKVSAKQAQLHVVLAMTLSEFSKILCQQAKEAPETRRATQS